MGLFDSFKKKVKETSEEINPLHTILTDANLGDGTRRRSN